LIKNAIEKGIYLDEAIIEEVVKTSDKQRFSLKDGKIRANQGHSTSEVEIQFTKREPPDILWHGTATKNLDKIKRDGLLKMKRHHVHLSDNYDAALKVGKRHGKPLVFAVDAKRMVKDGIDFFISTNGVWLVESIHFKYLQVDHSKDGLF